MLLMSNKNLAFLPINIDPAWHLVGMDNTTATFKFEDKLVNVEMPFADNQRCFIQSYDIETKHDYSKAYYLLPHVRGDHVARVRFVSDDDVTFIVADVKPLRDVTDIA